MSDRAREARDPGLVAIFAAGRNGSTMLGRLLDGSPDLYVHAPELNGLCALDDLAGRDAPLMDTLLNARTRPLGSPDREIPTRRLLDVYGGQWQEIEQEYGTRLVEPLARACDPAALLAQQQSWTARSFLPAFLQATQAAYDAGPADRPLLVFKTIETPYVEDYARTFPGLRCIHLFREPADNYASAKRTWSTGKSYPFYYGGSDLLRTFLDARWLPHARAALRLSRSAPGQHLLVRYEDVRADAAAALRRIFDWLGAAPAPEPDLLTALGGRHLRELPPNTSRPGAVTPRRVAPARGEAAAAAGPGGARGGDDVLTPRERELIAACTGPLAAELGYDVAPRRSSRLGLVAAWLPPDRSELQHARSRLRLALEPARRRAWVARTLATTPRPPAA